VTATRTDEVVQSRGPQRKRGVALEDAIREAAYAELTEVGYTAFSVEGVAARARTGKASIYRRWPNRLELVLEAIDQVLPRFDEAPDTGSVRGDLLLVLRGIAATMSSREGAAAKACVDGTDDELARAVRERLLPPRKAMMLEILRRGAARGEVRPDAVTTRIAETGPMLLHGEMLQRGSPIADDAVVAIVDEVLLPLLRP
jgi:AcrR family transcriptional regulator